MPARWRAMVPLGAATAPRVSEALGLTADRTGIEPPSPKPTLRIDRQLVVRTGEPAYLGPPKRKASRRDVPVPRVLVEALAEHLTAFPPAPREMVCRDSSRSCSAGSATPRRPKHWTSTRTCGPTARNAPVTPGHRPPRVR